MLSLLRAALVVCSMDAEPDGLYLVVCEGRREGMEAVAEHMVEADHMGAFCKAYEDDSIGDVVSFLVVCE